MKPRVAELTFFNENAAIMVADGQSLRLCPTNHPGGGVLRFVCAMAAFSATTKNLWFF